MPSTNDRARELAIAGAPHGTLVTAAEQTAGRGRQGRRWEAPAGSALLMSLVLRGAAAVVRTTPSMAALAPKGSCYAPLPMRAAVAVCDTIGAEARVKWPNDIVMMRADEAGNRTFAKLGGILIEGRPQEGWTVLGIGLNVAVRLQDLPPQLRQTAATLGREAAAIQEILAQLLIALERHLSNPADMTLNAWRERDVLRGREITWVAGCAHRRGRAEGIDEHGRLIVMSAQGHRMALDAGEIHLQESRVKPS